MQESLVRAFRFFDQAQDEEKKAWFFQVVRNTCYSWLKKNRNFYELTEDVETKIEDLSASPEESALQECTISEI